VLHDAVKIATQKMGLEHDFVIPRERRNNPGQNVVADVLQDAMANFICDLFNVKIQDGVQGVVASGPQLQCVVVNKAHGMVVRSGSYGVRVSLIKGNVQGEMHLVPVLGMPPLL
jgi:hypothetical protein